MIFSHEKSLKLTLLFPPIIIPVVFVFRIVNAFLVQTYFNPDEFWQAGEVAHSIVFGYGYRTWEWTAELRSVFHPGLFAAVFAVLSALHLDTPFVVSVAPRILQALFAACGDLATVRLASRLWGQRVGFWTLFCQLCSWFTFYVTVRTLSNSLEMVLTVSSLSMWPWPGLRVNQRERKIALFLAFLSCVVRPTSAVLWILLGLAHFAVISWRKRAHLILGEVVPLGGLVMGGATLLDRAFFGKWTFVPYNFLHFNVFTGGSASYGTHPFHWYFTQGFPAMSFVFLPLILWGVWRAVQWKDNRRGARILSAVCVLYFILVFSMLGHKEFRFVFPVLPLSFCFAGYALSLLESKLLPSNKKRDTPVANWRRSVWMVLLIVLVLSNVGMAGYFSLVHQRAPVSVISTLRTEAPPGSSVDFLTPCHSTPFYGMIHRPISMRILDCSPLSRDKSSDGLTQSERFELAPLAFAESLYEDGVELAVDEAEKWQLPSHFVLFLPDAERLSSFLSRHGYQETHRFFHTHFAVDREFQSHMLIFERSNAL